MKPVLSVFCGAGLLDRGFEQSGFCIVRGPDVIYGQDIRDFHPLPGCFVGIIGGPPCQDFSRMRRCPPTGYGVAMLREFARCVTEAKPDWWLMENVPGVPTVTIPGYVTQRFNCMACEFGLRQRRNRAFQFGSCDGTTISVLRDSPAGRSQLLPAALASDESRSFAELCELQGLPRGFDLSGLSQGAKKRAVGNGVPVPMARAIAEAIRDRHALRVTVQADAPLPGFESLAVHTLGGHRLCECDCGRRVTGKARLATAACRKRSERRRKGQTVPILAL